MDYRELLKKYINHVGKCEGVDFIDSYWSEWSEFTKEEWEELHKLCDIFQEH